MLPVLRALRAQVPDVEVTLMALTTAHAAAVAAGETPSGFADFVQLADPAFAAHWGARLAKGNNNPAVGSVETAAYLGVNFWDLVQQLGMEPAQARYAQKGRRGFYPVHFFRRLIEHLGPDVVLATNSPRSEQAAIDAAVGLGVPTLSMLDLFALHSDSYLKRKIYADRMTVLSQITCANLVAAGVPADRIVITGNPAFDECMGRTAEAAGRQWRATHGWDDLRVVLWAGQREPDGAPAPWAGEGLGDMVQEQLLRWIDEHPGAGLVVRYHPNDWHRFTPPRPHPRVHWSRPDREALLPVLAAANDVLVQTSTVGLQAAIAGKRVVCLRFSPNVQASTGMDLSRLGLGVGVDRLQDLPTLLATPPASTGTRSGQAVLEATGGAAQRVVEVVLDLVGQRAHAKAVP
ncbi:UDP-glycosyltransferase [Verminephrobacter aporrectodeae]|uniref:UDP-glycosyltransferase n=1 Tax=Verminephrobacter aporrectodeae TaxID=1110389 RepID=UPI0022385213|nr:UDP-glycosyltransferase [Verminephrobacter aporrectodeae]